MPHYKNAQPATVGELIHHKPSGPFAATNPEVLGILVSISACEQCNGQLLPVARKWPGMGWLPTAAPYQECISLKDCLPVGGVELSDPTAAPSVGGVELSDPTAAPSAEPVPQADGDPRPVAAL